MREGLQERGGAILLHVHCALSSMITYVWTCNQKMAVLFQCGTNGLATLFPSRDLS